MARMEVISGVERRRRWSEEATRLGVYLCDGGGYIDKLFTTGRPYWSRRLRRLQTPGTLFGL
jgi:hypothetical protein